MEEFDIQKGLEHKEHGLGKKVLDSLDAIASDLTVLQTKIKRLLSVDYTQFSDEKREKLAQEVGVIRGLLGNAMDEFENITKKSYKREQDTSINGELE